MQDPQPLTLNRIAGRFPPHSWFVISAISHYLGPAFAVLLFPAIGVLGIAWFRVASAALIFAAFSNPLRTVYDANPKTRLLLVAMGGCLAVMNTSFYLALDRLPMSLVAAMEFIGIIVVALFGVRNMRNLLALVLVITGVIALIDVKWASDPIGLFWSALNAVLFSAYVFLGHKAAEDGASGGVERLGAAMAIAFVFLVPIGMMEALSAFQSPTLVLAAIGVGICSSVVPYICDQLAMSRLPRASFALMLSSLPVAATIIAAVILGQIPDLTDIAGILLVTTGIAFHVPKDAAHSSSPDPKDVKNER